MGEGSRGETCQGTIRHHLGQPWGHRASGAGAWQEAAALLLCQADPAANTRSQGQAEGNVRWGVHDADYEADGDRHRPAAEVGARCLGLRQRTTATITLPRNISPYAWDNAIFWSLGPWMSSLNLIIAVSPGPINLSHPFPF